MSKDYFSYRNITWMICLNTLFILFVAFIACLFVKEFLIACAFAGMCAICYILMRVIVTIEKLSRALNKERSRNETN